MLTAQLKRTFSFENPSSDVVFGPGKISPASQFLQKEKKKIVWTVTASLGI